MTTSKSIQSLMLAATAALAMIGASGASAATWACGDGLTCHDLPCNVGDTSLPNGDGPNGEYNYPHCVSIKVANGSLNGKLVNQAGGTSVVTKGKATATELIPNSIHEDENGKGCTEHDKSGPCRPHSGEPTAIKQVTTKTTPSSVLKHHVDENGNDCSGPRNKGSTTCPRPGASQN